MQKTAIIVVIILCSSISATLNAQQFNLGVNINLMPFKAQYPKNNGSAQYPNYELEEVKSLFINFQANGGFDFQFLKFNDDKMSVGVNLNLAAGYLINPAFEGLNSAFTIDIPQYITIRYGQRATKYSDEGIGFGLGLGYNYQIIPFPLGSPNIFIDCTFGEGWFVKLSYDLMKNYFYNSYSSEGLVPAFEYRQIGIQIGQTI